VTPTPLSQYLRVARRQAWLIVLVPVIALGVAGIIVSQQDPVYRASMDLVVGQSGGDVQPVIGSQPLTRTMTNLLESTVVAKTVIDNLGLDITPQSLLERIHVATRPESSVLGVSYDSASRAEALSVVSQIATVFTRLVDDKLGIRSRTGGFQASGARPLIFATVFDPPHLEPDRVSPKSVRTLGLAGALGLVIGIVLAIARENLDDRIRTKREAEEAFGAPVIGALPKGARGNPLFALNGEVRGREGLIDALHLLQARLMLPSGKSKSPMIIVTSALQDDGKSTVVANLGTIMALSGKDVICIEADFRRPSLHRYFMLNPGLPGLTDLIESDADLETVLQPITLIDKGVNAHAVTDVTATYGHAAGPESRGAASEGRLRVLPMGHAVENPAAVLSRKKVEGVLADLAKAADYLIFDVPPLVVSDAFPLLLRSNTVLVVARRGRTTRMRAQGVQETLAGLGTEQIAVVLTDAEWADAYGRYAG
jgi:capsular polysaccharide biosynthesis protein/MinD-like ATPase involved in chromosome partitioning or flagellar assembly